MNSNEKLIKHWANLYEGRETIDEKLAKYREYFGKGLCMAYECRPNRISDLIDFTVEPPVSPLGLDGIPLPAINHPYRLVSIIREKERNVEYLSEGLIVTYPVDKLIQTFRAFCKKNLDRRLSSLKCGDVYRYAHPDERDKLIIELVTQESNNPALVSFSFPLFHGNTKENEEFKKSLVDRMAFCGYNLSYPAIVSPGQVKQPFKDAKIDLNSFMFEAMFFEPTPKLSDTLYHVAPSRYFDKIKIQGLIPRSKSDMFKYPERVYLFNKATVADAKKYGLIKIRSLDQHHSNPHVSDNGFYIFSIKRKTLENYQPYIDKKTIFYYDPCYDGGGAGLEKSKAIFTYNNIPRNLLEDECWYYEIDNATGWTKPHKTVSMK